MRKLDGKVAVSPFGNGARLTIKTPTGEDFIVDLSAEAAAEVREGLAGFAVKAEPSPVVPAKAHKGGHK